MEKVEQGAIVVGTGIGVVHLIEFAMKRLGGLAQKFWRWFTYYSEIRINIKDNPMYRILIQGELRRHEALTRYMTVRQGRGQPEFDYANGNYSFNVENIGDICISIKDDIVKISMKCKKSIEKLQRYFQSCYPTYFQPSNRLIFIHTDRGKWALPIFRERRNLIPVYSHNPIQQVIEDIETFRSNQQTYKNEARPYRRGYYLWGNPGTGKSLTVEVLATLYNMPIYTLDITDPKMSDTAMVSMLGQIPANSIVTIDDIGNKWEALGQRDISHVTFGGLLSAIDGPQRLNEGTIFILTSNTRNFVQQAEMAKLIRPGRIDMEYNYQTQLNG